MRKFIALVIAILIALSPLAAVTDLSNLSDEAKYEYITSSLSIQTKENSYSYSTGIGDMHPFGFYTASSWATGTTETEWIPYRGASEISKAEFFRLTGEEDLYNAFLEGMKTERAMHTAGWSIFGAGLGVGIALLITGLVLDGYEDSAIPLWCYIGGTAATVVGLAGLPLVYWEFDDNVSVSFAISLANIYNERLKTSPL